MKTQYALAALAVLVLSNAPLHAATMTASQVAPVIDGEDIANYGTVTGSDKWWVENTPAGAAKGQGFTTGSAAVRLKSITYQIAAPARQTKYYVLISKFSSYEITKFISGDFC